MFQFLGVGLLSLICCVPSFAKADVLKIPLGQQGLNVDRPATGMTKNQVKNHYGDADDQIAAVGDPPISSWVYRDFIVYFEDNYVIHSVAKHRPQYLDN